MTIHSLELDQSGSKLATKPKDLIVSPNQYFAAALRLAWIAREASNLRGERFHTLIGLGRGGWFAAWALSGNLHASGLQVYNASIKTYKDQDREQTGLIEFGQMPTPEEVEGRNHLIVDDLVQSDRTRRAAVGTLYSMGANLVRFAVPYYKDPTYNRPEPDYDVTLEDVMREFPPEDPRSQRPDYFAVRTHLEQWITSPLEQAEQTSQGSGYSVFHPASSRTVIDLASRQ